MLHALAAALLGAPGDLQVTNIEAGTLVRYPVVMLQGSTPGREVAAGVGWKSMSKFPAPGGRFVALVELKPGMNMVLVTSGPEVLKLRLDYKPMSTPYHVACVYLAPKDEATDFDAPPGDRADQYGEKLDTVLKMLQSYTAESMNDAGFGRVTFPLEFGPKGRVIVHVIRSSHTGVELRAMDDAALWDLFNPEISHDYNGAASNCFGVMSFSRYDPTTGTVHATAKIEKDGFALVGGQNMLAWPTSLADVPNVFSDATPVDGRFHLDDSSGRGTMWAQSSTTMGEDLQLLLKSFVPGDFPLFDGINRAFTCCEPPCKLHDQPLTLMPDDSTHWDATVAATLSKSPWFRPDGSSEF